MLFWITRFCLIFATVVLIAFSWRASVIVGACTLLEFIGMIMAGMPGTGVWTVARLMLGLGLVVGIITSLGKPRSSYWELPLLALVVNALLALSWGSALIGLEGAWIGYVVSAVSLPAGCLCSAAAFDLYHRMKRERAERGA